MTNTVEINDEVRHDISHPAYKAQEKKPYGVGNQESNRLAWQSSGTFHFALCKSAEKALSVSQYAKSEGVGIHRNCVGSLQSRCHKGQSVF